MSAGAQTPPSPAVLPPKRALPPVRFEVANPADAAAVEWVCGLFGDGQADLYVQDEADLALLPTITRTWMLKGQQLKLRAPGSPNAKRSVSAASDLSDGTVLWRTDERRCADQFGLTLTVAAHRSAARGRLAVLLVDNAPSHQVGKTGIVRQALNSLAGEVVLVFLPKYSPDLNPAEHLWRPWRANVTHNHKRATIEELVADSDGWLGRLEADRKGVLRVLGYPNAYLSASLAA